MAKKKTGAGPGDRAARLRKLEMLLTPDEKKQAAKIGKEVDFKVLKYAYYVEGGKPSNQKQQQGVTIGQREEESLRAFCKLSNLNFDEMYAKRLEQKTKEKAGVPI
jgi:hypothetical protein